MQDQLVYSAEHEICVKCYCNYDEMQWQINCLVRIKKNMYEKLPFTVMEHEIEP